MPADRLVSWTAATPQEGPMRRAGADKHAERSSNASASDDVDSTGEDASAAVERILSVRGHVFGSFAYVVPVGRTAARVASALFPAEMQLDSALVDANRGGRLRLMAVARPLFVSAPSHQGDTDIQLLPPPRPPWPGPAVAVRSRVRTRSVRIGRTTTR